MKGFLVGLMVGGLAAAIGNHLLRAQPDNPPVANSIEAVSEEVASKTSASETSAAKARPFSQEAVDARTTTPSTAVQSSLPPDDDPAPDLPAKIPATRRSPSAEDMGRKCGAWRLEQARKTQAARESEPKDPQWAYATEQLLEQYIADHPLAATFEVRSVDCRTGHCIVKAISRELEGNINFEKVLRDAMAAPWGEFSQGSSGSSQLVNGSYELDYMIYRADQSSPGRGRSGRSNP